MTWLELATLLVATFALSLGLTAGLIPILRARQFGKAIRQDGPAHQAKAGTPTMGGLGALAAIALAAAWIHLRPGAAVLSPAPGGLPLGTNTDLLDLQLAIVWPMMGLAGFALLGALDDWQGLARKGQARELGVGWTARRMLAAQLMLGITLVALVTWLGGERLSPAWAGSLVGLVVAVVAIVGTVNGVNFSDGLDGLAAGLVILALGALGLASAMANTLHDPITGNAVVGPVTALALAAAAAMAGFLVFNRHPATVFMGNVTSMALGALLACLALATPIWFLLPVLGAVFLVEVLSDIVQIAYFKATGGRRLLRMAPLHHHFELGGWPETRVVERFWLFGFAAALATLAGAAFATRP